VKFLAKQVGEASDNPRWLTGFYAEDANLSDASDFLLVEANGLEIRFDVLARATTALQEYHLLPHCLESNTSAR
jgi:hypothetical protein